MSVIRTLISKRIEEIEITLVRSQAGEFGAYTTQEPLFFLTDSDEGKLRERVGDALTDYLQRFHGENATVEVIETVSPPEPIRVERGSRLAIQLEYA